MIALYLVDAARAYCAVIEQPVPVDADANTDVERGAAVRQVLTALGDVVAAVLHLPHGVQSPEVPDGLAVDVDDWGAGINHERWLAVYRRVGQLLGPAAGYYWEVTYPFDVAVPAGAQAATDLGDLSDDLADIWRDLREGLDALDAGAEEGAVVEDLRMGYWVHWGHHAASAMRVLLLHATGYGQRPGRDD